jgi:ubiquinone/menaquinone biosynthesis C-methylase UbiE
MSDDVAIRDAYGDGAEAWASGPSIVYARLAEVLVERMPVARSSMVGAAVADVGAGTGVLSEALLAAGARPVACDFAWAMLAHRHADRPPAIAADARRLPLRDAAVDGVGSAFCINHLEDPVRALSEMARVTRPGGFVVTTTYARTNDHPAKAAVDAAAAELGFVAPEWYRSLKGEREARSNDVDKVGALATAAGLTPSRVSEEVIDVGVDRAELLVRWRLGMAALAAFARTLDDGQRAALHRRALELVGDDPEPYRPRVIILVATAPAR